MFFGGKAQLVSLRKKYLPDGGDFDGSGRAVRLRPSGNAGSKRYEQTTGAQLARWFKLSFTERLRSALGKKLFCRVLMPYVGNVFWGKSSVG